MAMEADSVRSDINSTGNTFKSYMEQLAKWLARQLKKIFMMLFKRGMARHMNGYKRVQKDGSTKEIATSPELSYEEMLYVAEKARKDGIDGIAMNKTSNPKEFKPDKKLKRASKAQMERYIKNQHKLEKAQEKLAKKPDSTRLSNKVAKYKNEIKKEAELRKNMKYAFVVNVRHSAWLNKACEEAVSKRKDFSISKFREEMLEKGGMSKEFTEARLHQLEEMIKNHPEYSVMTKEQQEETFKAYINTNGSVNKEYFNDKSFIVHTVDGETAAKIAEDFEHNGNDFRFALRPIKDENKVNVYFEADKLSYYANQEYANEGSFAYFSEKNHSSVADISDNVDSKDRAKFKNIPLDEGNKIMEQLKDEDFQMFYSKQNGETRVTFMLTKDQASRVIQQEAPPSVHEEVKEAQKSNIERFISSYKNKEGFESEFLSFATNPYELANSCNRELTNSELEACYNVCLNGTEAEINSFADRINNKNKGETVRESYFRSSFQEHAPVAFENLPSDKKEGIMNEFGFKNNSDARNYFDNHSITVASLNNEYGYIIDDKNNKESSEFISSVDFQRVDVNNSSPETPNKDNIENTMGDISDTVDGIGRDAIDDD